MRRHPITGQIAHGIAGDGVYVDGVQIAPGGGQSGMPDWWGDLVIHHKNDVLHTTKPDGSDTQAVTSGTNVVPASFVRASAHGWAAWSNATGVVTSWGLKLPKAELFDMASDGTLLVGDFYHPEQGKGISAYRAGSTTRLWQVPGALSSRRTYSQASILDEKTACWTEMVNGRQALVGFGLPTGPRPPWDVVDSRPFFVNGQLWVVYIRPGKKEDNSDNTVVAHPWDYKGLGFFVHGVAYGCEAWQEGEEVILAWSIGAGETAGDIKTKPFSLAALEAIPDLPPPPPPDNFGPISEPDPDGTVVPDIAAYMAAETPWSRTGTHTMQSVRDGQFLHLGKFYDPGPPKNFKSKDHYESWAITDDAIHLLRDASNSPEYYDFVHTKWLPRTMKTGYAHLHDSGESEIVFYKRGGGCTAGKHVGFHNRIWLQTWEKFDCGPYLGVNKVLAVMTDPTNGWHGNERGVERGLFAMGPDGKAIANLSWEYHRSAFDPAATGQWAGKGIYDFDPPEFNDQTLIARSDFYMPTNVSWVPNLVPCPLTITDGPPPPPPPPVPPPPPTPTPMNGILKPGQRLLVNQPLYSQDGRFFLVLQGSDSNLAKYGPNGWAKSLFGGRLIGKPVASVDMQGDGNFVPYDAQVRPFIDAFGPIASHTSGHPGAWLAMQNDGHVVIYDVDGTVLWTDGVGPYAPPPAPPPPPIPPVPPGGVTPDMKAWPKFGASYNAGMTNPSCDPALFAALNRDAGGNFTRVNTIDAWAVGPNGTGQYAGFMPWQKDSAGVFDLSVPDPRWDERLNYYVRAQNAAGATVQLTVFDLYSWSDRKQGLLWVPDVNLGPFRRNKNGVRWGGSDNEDATFLALPDWVMLQHIQRMCAAVKGLAVCFETGNEMPEKDMHIRIAQALRSHFTPDWSPDITTNRQEDTSGQYFNMKIGTNFDRIAFHGKDSIGYLDEVFEDEPSSRPNTFRKLFEQPWQEGPVDPKRIIMSSDGCRVNSTMDCYDWPRLAEVFKDHIRRGFTVEHQSRVKMQPFLEGKLELQKYFEGDWLRSVRA